MTDAKRLLTTTAVLLGWTTIVAQSLAADDGKSAARSDEAARVGAIIDRHLAETWKTNNVEPAPVADDAEFLRRTYLNIAGRIPRVAEVREFLADKRPDKRRRVVAELLESPGYITHYTTFWRNVLIPEVNADIQARYLVPGFEAWLRGKLQEDAPYDSIVREMLTVEISRNNRRTQNYFQRLGEPTPIAFFQSKQAKPENLAAAASRVFLGVRIECAQCHDHPFDSWKQEQFWGFAAFFAGLQSSGDNVFSPVSEIPDRREIAIPETDKVVQAMHLNGDEPQWRFRQGARETLAEWMTAKDNPYFAKAAVNRMWGKLMGVGLVDPVDDFSAANPASNPELLDELAREFVKQNCDVKFLIAAIAASKTYQRTSRRTDESQSNPQLFARMAVQGMSPEQFVNSLATAVGHFEPYQSRNPYSFGGNDVRTQLEELFANESEAPTERTTSILQALALMNGSFVAGATSVQGSRTLAAVLDFPLATTADRIETLYLAALSRKPRKDELQRLVKYVDSGGPKKDSAQALSDVFWSLLNSSEFLLNH